MALVIKKFFVSHEPREDGVYVEIQARQSGFFSWLFALFGLDPNYSLSILYDKVVYQASSINGFNKVILPIHSVSSIYFGTVRPWGKALFWFSLFVAGAYAAAELGETAWVVISVVVGLVIAILVYILNRELTIGVTEVTNTTYPLVLKRSVIEGQEISEAKLAEISQIFVALLDAHKAAERL
jgi:hypothetical protein